MKKVGYSENQKNVESMLSLLILLLNLSVVKIFVIDPTKKIFELKTLKGWISRSILDPLFLLFSRLI